MNFIWKTQTGQYQSGENLYINRICVGSYSWNSTISKFEAPEIRTTQRYVGNFFLPGISKKIMFGATPEEIKGRIEKLVTDWFAEINRE